MVMITINNSKNSETDSYREDNRDNEIIDQLNKATQHNRNTLLKYKTKEIKNNMVFLTKYHNQLPNIGKAIDDNWNHLHINAKISSAFT